SRDAGRLFVERAWPGIVATGPERAAPRSAARLPVAVETRAPTRRQAPRYVRRCRASRGRAGLVTWRPDAPAATGRLSRRTLPASATAKASVPRECPPPAPARTIRPRPQPGSRQPPRPAHALPPPASAAPSPP